jgi:hypothetical protein
METFGFNFRPLQAFFWREAEKRESETRKMRENAAVKCLRIFGGQWGLKIDRVLD